MFVDVSILLFVTNQTNLDVVQVKTNTCSSYSSLGKLI